jgi:hypothetical protein
MLTKLPLNLTSSEQQKWSVGRMSAGANILQDCMFIVWDKCTMSHEAALET